MADSLNGNVKAFLAVIRHCEGTDGPDGYRTLFGGGLFDDFSRHPGIAITRTLRGVPITSTAAGAYQFLKRTWDGLVKQYNFPDFSPFCQDQGAIALIRGRGALADVEAGRFEDAIRKCNKEWASLPGSPYGQPVKTIEYCKRIYEQNGGVYMVAPLVAAAAKPFVIAAAEALVEQLPTLRKLWGSGSPVAERNADTIELAVNVVKEAVGAKNEQEAVEMVKMDPAAKEAADAAVRANAFDIGGVDLSNVGEARQHDQARAKEVVPFWKTSPAFWVTILLMPLVYLTLIMVLKGDVSSFTPEVKASVATGVISLTLGGIVGFWLGASFTTSSSRGLNARPQ